MTRTLGISRRNVDAIHAATLVNGGSTFTTAGVIVAPTVGYIVGGILPTIVVPLAEFTAPFLAGVMQGWSGHPHYVEMMGTWVHDGHVYIDASEHIIDRATAVETGRMRGEIAIYSMLSGKEITL